MKSAFSLIEMVLAIVVISLCVSVVPLVVEQSARLNLQNQLFSAISQAEVKMFEALNLPFGVEANLRDESRFESKRIFAKDGGAFVESGEFHKTGKLPLTYTLNATLFHGGQSRAFGLELNLAGQKILFHGEVFNIGEMREQKARVFE